MKKCSKCKTEKDSVEFHTGSRGRLRAACKKCTNELSSVRHDPVKARRRTLLRVYGLSLEDYEKMLGLQNHRCAICKSSEKTCPKQRFHVDHDHDTGEVRALLCNLCNQAIGMLKDNPDLCETAANYLRKYGK